MLNENDVEIPEREADTTSVPTDLTITDSTISSSDLNASATTSQKASKGRGSKQNGQRDNHKGGDGDGARRVLGGCGKSANQRKLEEKYDQLLSEVNELRVTQAAKVSSLESELRLKSFELKRSEQQMQSLQGLLKTTAREKSEACNTVKNLRDELNSSRRASDLEVCNLTMSLHEKSLKLEMYEKIQAKIDNVLFPDLPVSDAAVGDTNVDGILSNFGYGNVSVDAKMRLQQSLDLAKRLASERDHLEKSREETQLKLNEVEKRYHSLLIEFNHLKLSDKYQTSELQSELKLKKFELGRLNILYAEMDAKFKDMLLEKQRLAEKLDGIREEYSNSKSNAENKITALTLQLQEKSTRLEAYNKLEAELDKVVVQAAALPNQEDADRVLAAYGYGTTIPSNMKRRLEQSLKLARRVLELETFSAEQKTELFTARDRNIILKRELESMQTSIQLSGQPTSELLQVIQKRDLAILKLGEKIKELELDIKRITTSNKQLQGKITQLEAKSAEPKKPTYCVHKRYTPTAGQFKNNGSNQPTSSSSRPHTTAPSCLKRVSFRTYQRGSDSSIILPVAYKKVSESSSDSHLHIKKPLSFSKMSFPGELCN